MANTSQLEAKDIRNLMNQFFEALVSHREALNMLNVYPVPDGDTGTNMTMTAESVVNALEELSEDAEIADVTSAIAHGSLMGARGNSGVILSQVLRAFSSEIGSAGSLNADSASKGLSEAAEAAYGAVMTPVEGTILTVVRESSEAAEIAKEEGNDLLGIIEAALERGKDALARTPEMLPVLAEAGVVDAGGSGYLLLLDALLNVIDGRPLPEAPEVNSSLPGAGESQETKGSLIEGPRYEVMYFLEAQDELIPSLKETWNQIGDSIVVVGGDGTWNCHVHTDDIGAAIEAGISVGRPYKIRVSDLLEEAEEQAWVREQMMETHEEEVGPPVPCAVVAVANGVGIVDIFHSLGVQKVIAGGQSMNPSTEQLLEAVEIVPSDEIVILPNNGNIIPVAEQVDGQTSKTVRVVRTKGITEGFASLLEYDPQGTAEENLEGMSAAASQVVAGEVTIAVRDSGSDAGEISEGDYLGLSDGKVKVIASSLYEVTTQLIDKLIEDHELVTLIAGAEVEDSTTAEIVSWLEKEHPMVELETHFGGQPLYQYFLGIE